MATLLTYGTWTRPWRPPARAVFLDGAAAPSGTSLSLSGAAVSTSTTTADIVLVSTDLYSDTYLDTYGGPASYPLSADAASVSTTAGALTAPLTLSGAAVSHSGSLLSLSN